MAIGKGSLRGANGFAKYPILGVDTAGGPKAAFVYFNIPEELAGKAANLLVVKWVASKVFARTDHSVSVAQHQRPICLQSRSQGVGLCLFVKSAAAPLHRQY